jgi:hypothetical protein
MTLTGIAEDSIYFQPIMNHNEGGSVDNRHNLFQAVRPGLMNIHPSNRDDAGFSGFVMNDADFLFQQFAIGRIKHDQLTGRKGRRVENEKNKGETN